VSFCPLENIKVFWKTISGPNDFEVGQLERKIITKENFNILPIICYEIIFDKIFSNINDNNIDLLINITNDAWFGKKIGPYQHLYLTRIKSVIANRPMIRVSNNGISAIINKNGKILKYIKLDKKNKINYKLKIEKSLNYIFIHNLFLVYLAFLFFIILLLARYETKQKYNF
jgi:Apolipoprotein N-acyltransferase